MRDKPAGHQRFQTPLRLQGRDSVRVIWPTEEAADWFDETWDPVVRERLRLMGQALRPVVGLAERAREALAEALNEPEFLATPPRRRCPGAY